MNHKKPPVVATWLFDHLRSGEENEALSGDLIEGFRSGRSASWYWRQILTAIVIRCFSEIRTHSLALIFALIWSIPIRAWWFFALWYAARDAEYIFPTPYSTDLGMFISVVFTLWIGLGAYSLIYSLAVHKLNLEGFVRGFFVGPIAFFLLTVLFKSLPLRISVANFGAVEVLAYFLSLTIAAWGIRPQSRRLAV
jgi:hypothetical protein